MNDTDKKPTPIKSKPGHADVLGDPVTAPRRLCIMRWTDSLAEATDFARENGLWFATGTSEGAKSPETVEKQVNEGKKLWEIFGLPPGFNPQSMMQAGDIFQLELIDPIRAAQQLRARADGAGEAAKKILDELKK